MKRSKPVLPTKLICTDGFFLYGQSWSQLEKQIAANTGLNKKTVHRHLRIAEERGWIERIETEDGIGIKFTVPGMKP